MSKVVLAREVEFDPRLRILCGSKSESETGVAAVAQFAGQRFSIRRVDRRSGTALVLFV
jgi:hypothetical protein